jgi:MbtH protein
MNAFEVPDGTYCVLVNGAGQYSLWPAFADAPAGWAVAHGPTDRPSCVDFVARNWTDLRPRPTGR